MNKEHSAIRDGRYPNFGQAAIAANYFTFAIIAIFLKFVNNNE